MNQSVLKLERHPVLFPFGFSYRVIPGLIFGEKARMERSLTFVDNESKDDEDFVLSTSATTADDDGMDSRPSRENVTQLLRAFHPEQLIELLATYVQDDPATYSRLIKDAENDVHRRKLFVHGLPARTTEDQFRKFFEQYGTVELVELPHAKAHSEVKFGFVVFATVQSLRAALEQPNKQFDGKEICCKIFTVRSSSVDGSPTSIAQSGALGSNKRVFVSGLAPFVADRDLYEHFKLCGEIEVAQVIPGKATGYVLFADASGAREAIVRLNKSFLGGRQITVAWYRKQDEFRRQQLPAAQVVRPSVQTFATPAISGTAFTPTTSWFNYATFVQDPYAQQMLMHVPVFQAEYQVEPFFNPDDQDRKAFQ